MLSPATPFPHIGSYALFRDEDLPRSEQVPELVRILEKGAATVLVAFPLREGVASGNKRIPIFDLLDGTPLTAAEKVEEHQLFGRCLNRTPRTARQKAEQARLDALRSRMIWSGCLQRKLDLLSAMNRRTASNGLSGGQAMGEAA